MSVEIQIQHEGWEDFTRKIERLDSAMKNHVQTCLTELANSIKEKAQELAPTKTGYLRSTIFAETEEWTVKVGARAPYAYFVEFGTRFIRARSFLSQALEVHISQLEHVFDYAINEALREAEAI